MIWLWTRRCTGSCAQIPAQGLVASTVAACCLAPQLVQAQSVTQQFQKARRAYEAGKTKSAVKMLTKIVKRYPDHQPSHLLLGRIAFRAGKVNRAARHFKRVPTDMVAANVAYEYGVSMFVANDFARAALALSRVPSSAREANLSYFYRGISYMRLGDNQKAYAVLNRAKNLPAHLEPSRREALSSVLQKLRVEGPRQTPSPYLIVPPPPMPLVVPPPTGAAVSAEADEAGAARKPPPLPPSPPKAGFSTAMTPSFKLTQQNDTLDLHGFGIKDAEIRTTVIALGLSGRYDAAPRGSGGQAFGVLGLTLDQTTVDTKGSGVVYVALESDPTSIVEQETVLPNTSSKYANVQLKPEAGYPLSEALDLKGAFVVREVYPDMRPNNKTSSRGPEGRIGYGMNGLNLALTGSQLEVFDGKNIPVKTAMQVKGEAIKAFETASLDLTFTQTTNDNLLPTLPLDYVQQVQVIDGGITKNWETSSVSLSVINTTWTPFPGQVWELTELASLKVELSATKTFEFGGALTLTASQSKQDNVQRLFQDTSQPPAEDGAYPKKVVRANNTAQAAGLSIKLAPLSWLSLSSGFTYTQHAYVVSDPAFELAWQQAVPDVVSSFVLAVTASKSF